MDESKANKMDLSKVSRRQFLFTGASVAILAGVPLRSHAASDEVDRYQFGQLTLDGGESPFAVPWLDKNGSHNQAPGPNSEPASIYHFKGFVARCNDFKGMGSDNNGNRIAFGAPSTDFSLLSGEYWADRMARTGGFSHIWLTLFQGQAVPANKIHDFHPPISPCGLYWVTPVPTDGIKISGDGLTAVLEMKDLSVIDQPKWPSHGAAATAALMSFRVVWKATDEKVVYEDKLKHYKVEGYRATAQLEASVNVPSINFSWKSDPIETSSANFAIMGTEVNGKYYDP
jgi:hypothetical protein